jgi:hypothetical protein
MEKTKAHNVLIHQLKPTMEKIDEKDILNHLNEYYLVDEDVIINVESKTLYLINMLTSNYELEKVEEVLVDNVKSNESIYHFKFNGIIVNQDKDINYSFSALNESHAWNLLREVLISKTVVSE